MLAGQEWAAPTPVIAESAWLILERLGTGPHQRFLQLVTTGQLEAIDLTDEDWRRCVTLTETYADLRLDLADASLVAVAERLGQTAIATLNHRDFRSSGQSTARRSSCCPRLASDGHPYRSVPADADWSCVVRGMLAGWRRP